MEVGTFCDDLKAAETFCDEVELTEVEEEDERTFGGRGGSGGTGSPSFVGEPTDELLRRLWPISEKSGKSCEVDSPLSPGDTPDSLFQNPFFLPSRISSWLGENGIPETLT